MKKRREKDTQELGFLPLNSLSVIAITGGIATGKSTCCRYIQEVFPEMVLFDADASVSHLYESEAVKEELLAHFGEKLLSGDGEVDKSYLREKVFADDEERRFIEQVFHPRVMQECLALLAETATKGASRLFVADIPLLFERGIHFGQSANILVATSRSTQISRLKKRNGWDDATVNKVLQSQMPIDAKLKLADIVFWNEGPPEILKLQIDRYLSKLS